MNASDRPVMRAEGPLISVAIPTFNPGKQELGEALHSVLAQAGADMEVLVVDDCSGEVDVEAMVRELAGERVRVVKSAENRGLAGGWNRCVEEARGLWIHLLHQDDWVLPGFYSTVRELAGRFPEAGAVCTRNAYANAAGETIGASDLERTESGLLSDWLARLGGWQRVQCAAVVVKREAYEQLGGFRADLPYVLDWEMWVRIAREYPWAYSPEVLAAYRMHPGSATARLRTTQQALPDFVKGFDVILDTLPGEIRAAAARGFRKEFTRAVLKEAALLYADERVSEARALLLRFKRHLDAAQSLEVLKLLARCWVKDLRSRRALRTR